MRAFVTGGTGFVGRAVIELLRARGDAVTALVRDPERAKALLGTGVELVRGDLTGSPPAASVLAGHDVLIHTACARKATFASGADSAAAFTAVNTEGTRALARAWREVATGRFVHLSSTAAMGTPRQLPVTEDDPCHPATPYGRSKYEAEHALIELAKEGLACVILRPCLITGAGKEGGEVSTMLSLIERGRFPLIIGKERVRKPLVHVSDVARAVLLAAEQGKPGGTYLITSGTEYPLEDVVTTAAGLLGGRKGYISLPALPVTIAARVLGQINRWTGLAVPLTSERLELFMADRTYSIDRARKDLGYSPQVTDLTTMLEGSVKEYRAAR